VKRSAEKLSKVCQGGVPSEEKAGNLAYKEKRKKKEGLENPLSQKEPYGQEIIFPSGPR